MESLPLLLFSRDDVYIHGNSVPDNGESRVRGKLMIWKRVEGVFLQWKAVESNEGSAAGKDGGEWTMVPNSVSYKNEKSSVATESVTMESRHIPHRYMIDFDVKDLKSFKKLRPTLGYSYLIFILKCGTTHPALHFHRGGTKLVLNELRKHLTIQCSPQDNSLYLVREHDPQALSKSFDELHLFEREQASDIVGNFMRDPYGSALSGFSRVTHFLRDTLIAMDTSMGEALASQDPSGLAAGLGPGTPQPSDLGLDIKTLGESGFEMVTTKIDLPPRPKVTRGRPLNAQQWSSFMDSEGRVMKPAEVREIIFRGGIEPTLRTEVWKFLLGYYPWNSTSKQRVDERKSRVDDYFRMKLQWKSISADQESRFSDLRDRKSLIEKDVTRTDRVHKFFEGENNPNISILYDILLTYCMYNFDLGYVQGMSDLLAPVLVVMENEVDAFWCFVGFIKMVGLNFEKDQTAMKNQLLQLQTLINFVDPELANYLESHDSINMYFCFRWILIIFKREFTFPDIMRLWEVMWTGLPCQNFHLLLCLAILDSAKTTLMENNFGFTEILKYINDLSNTIDVEEMMTKAEAICQQLCACRDLPTVIHNLLGLSTSPHDRAPFNPVNPSEVEQDAPSHHSQNSPERSIAPAVGGDGQKIPPTGAGGDEKCGHNSSNGTQKTESSTSEVKNNSTAGGQMFAEKMANSEGAVSNSVGASSGSRHPSENRDSKSPSSDESSIEVLSEISEQFP